ncbi:afadin-like [Boleophthalmus pectinirostris]|uniref:afadin-like n=1 Tax=Boleophthalmus pectinirostris TaxID=150288 RepID=UPI00242FD7C1|nr:afadin-like [Boleophthalmus pectinirostris]
MEQEVHRLQAKSKRSVEESDRLKRLSLEFEFQKRLNEMEEREREIEDGQREREEEEKEGEREDLDIMRTIQELEPRTRVKRNTGNPTCAQKEKQTKLKLSWKDDQGRTDEKHNGKDANNKAANQISEEKVKPLAPEQLTFRERQQLFSLASSA